MCDVGWGGVSRVQLQPGTVQEFREFFRYFLSLCPHVQDRGSLLLFPHDPDDTPWPWPLTPILPNWREETSEAELVQKTALAFKHSLTSFPLEQTVGFTCSQPAHIPEMRICYNVHDISFYYRSYLMFRHFLSKLLQLRLHAVFRKQQQQKNNLTRQTEPNPERTCLSCSSWNKQNTS